MGFQVGFWDYVMFGLSSLSARQSRALFFSSWGFRGKIAIARKHPEADAVNRMGWVGFLVSCDGSRP